MRAPGADVGSLRYLRLTALALALLLCCFGAFARTVPITTALGGNGNQSVGAFLLAFFQRMADSSWSTGLHESRDAYDLIESVHVWALCLFFGLTVRLECDLFGAT